jgi:hypothetical protein
MRISSLLFLVVFILILPRQWGNVLTLMAAYQDPILTKLVDKDQLVDLLKKTIAFLKLCAQPSSALDIDCKILQHAGARLELIPPDPYVKPLFPGTKPNTTNFAYSGGHI